MVAGGRLPTGVLRRTVSLLRKESWVVLETDDHG
jgi:hypothetical protein